MGSIEGSLGHTEKAIGHYREASMGTCTGSAAPLMAQAQLLEKARDFDQARTKYREIKDRFPKTEEATLASERLREIAMEERRTGTEYSAVGTERPVQSDPQF